MNKINIDNFQTFSWASDSNNDCHHTVSVLVLPSWLPVEYFHVTYPISEGLCRMDFSLPLLT